MLKAFWKNITHKFISYKESDLVIQLEENRDKLSTLKNKLLNISDSL